MDDLRQAFDRLEEIEEAIGDTMSDLYPDMNVADHNSIVTRVAKEIMLFVDEEMDEE